MPWLGTEEDNVAAHALYRSRAGQSTPMLIFEFDDFGGAIRGGNRGA
jgi:hypothetical protein